MKKEKIQNFGKQFNYLKDPDLRKREAGDATLTLDSAYVSNVEFIGQSWNNIRFINCEFVGSHQIRPKSLEKVIFENCRFTGVFNLGVLKEVRFLDCQLVGGTHLVGDTGSRSTVFERCIFEGADSEPNSWGSVGTYGEATFIDCRGKWFDISGYAGLTLVSCEFDEVGCQPAGGGEGLYAPVLLERCKLRGRFNMVSADLQSLTIRDTVLDHLDLTNATIKDDLVIERVRGGAIQVGIKEAARAFSMKDSQIHGNGISVCYVYAGAFDSVLIERCIFGGDVTKPVIIAGGFDPDNKETQPVMTRRLTLRDNRTPFLCSGYLNASDVVIEGNTIESLDLQQGRLDSLEIAGNTITRSVNFTGTQAKKSKVQRLAKDQAKLDGSNIKLS